MESIEPQPTRRRTEIDIIVLILNHLKREPSRKNQIIMRYGISHRVLTVYLKKLIKSGHVLENQMSTKKGLFYTISESGNQLLLKLQESLDLVQEVLEVEEVLK